MTVKNIFEELKLIVPEAKQPFILQQIDNAQKMFADETRCLRKQGSLAGIDSNLSWSLPSDYLGLYRVDFYDSSGYPKYAEELGYSWDVEHGYFTIKSLDSTPLTEISSSVDAIYLNYYYQPGDIDEITDSLEVDEEFHDGIKARAIERLLAIFPTLEVAEGNRVTKLKDYQGIRYWNGVYNETRVKCKRHVNMEDESPKIYAGIYKNGFLIPPKRTEVDAVGSTTIRRRSEYSKLLVLEADSSTGTVTRHTDIDYGYTQANITVDLTGTTLTITNTDGFATKTYVVPSQSVNFSTSGDLQTITITFPASWGVCSIQIYEY